MQTVTFGLSHGWFRRAFDRNPLIRKSDRIESFVMMFALTFVLLGTTIIGAFGTSVQDSRAEFYADQQRTRHTVIATATADSRADTSYGSVAFIANARWNADGINRTGEFEWPESLKSGQQIGIWVDEQGKKVAAPAPLSQATLDAVMVAIGLWIAMAAIVLGVVRVVHLRLNRGRYAAWDRALEQLAGDDSGRTNSQP